MRCQEAHAEQLQAGWLLSFSRDITCICVHGSSGGINSTFRHLSAVQNTLPMLACSTFCKRFCCKQPCPLHRIETDVRVLEDSGVGAWHLETITCSVPHRTGVCGVLAPRKGRGHRACTCQPAHTFSKCLNHVYQGPGLHVVVVLFSCTCLLAGARRTRQSIYLRLRVHCGLTP